MTLESTVVQLARQNKDLLERVEKLEAIPRPILVPINTFAPRPFEVVMQILVVVEPVVDDNGDPCEYIATFTDGAISVTGDTIEEAVSLLKGRMASQFKLLTNLPPDRLGKIPQRQLDALQAVMRRIE